MPQSINQMYSEVDEANPQPTIEDIHEFAKRIGIDPVQEAHLLDVAKEGLIEKLPPSWKPCYEPHKKAWYYYNIESQSSQWEHPLDAVYRQKVSEIKTDVAMNRIQNFNPGKTPRSLPPLKVKPAGTVYGGGLFPSFNESAKSQQQQPDQISSRISSVLNSPPRTGVGVGHEDKEVGRAISEPFSSSRKLAPMPIQPLGRKASGLTISGAGASFLKSNSADSARSVESSVDNRGIPEQFKKLPNSNGNTDTSNSSSSEMSLKEPIIRRPGSSSAPKPTPRPLQHPQMSAPPLKSILAQSLHPIQRSQTHFVNSKAISNSASSNAQSWNLNPNSMTGINNTKKKSDPPASYDEKKLWSNFDKSDDDRIPLKNKSSVKFKLDENPELHFDISQKSESEDNKRQSDNENGSGFETTDDAFNIELESNSDSADDDEDPTGKSMRSKVKSSGSKESLIIPDDQKKPQTGTFSKISAKQLGGGEKPSDTGLFQKNQEAIKKSMEEDMKVNLKKFQTQLDNERLKRENQMREHVEQSLAQAQLENDDIIQKSKSDLEKSRQSQFDKMKREMEQILSVEIDKIRTENQQKLESRKRDLSMDYEKNLKDVEVQLSELNKSSMIQEKRQEFLKNIEKELQLEMKSVKETMREEQKKQIQQMKDYHSTFVEKLKLEFDAEADKLRKAHANSISESIAALNKDKDQLLNSLRTQQTIELEQLRLEFEQKKLRYTEVEEVSSPGKTGSTPVDDTVPRTLKSPDTIKRTAALESKEAELYDIKRKYKMLEDKYYGMKQDLQNVVVNANQQIKSSKNQTTVTVDEMSIGSTAAGATGNSTIIDDEHSHYEDGHGQAQNGHQSDHDHSSVQDSNSGGNGHQNQPPSNKKVSITDIIAGSNNRLNKALSALENLRDQIVEIKSDQNVKLAQTKVSPLSIPGHNVYPTKETQVYNVNMGDIGQYPSTVKAKKSSSKLIRPSVSVSDLQGGRKRQQYEAQVQVVDDDNNNSINAQRHVVEHAKDFIKSQKQRLLSSAENSSPLVLFSPTQQHFHSTFPRLKRIDGIKAAELALSEANTESSGIGTGTNSVHYSHLLYQNTLLPLDRNAGSSDRTQVAKDIDGILGSLKQLDKQMKYMWSVVGHKQTKRVNGSSMFSTLQPNHVDSPYQPQSSLLTPLIHPMSPPAMEHLDILVGNTSTLGGLNSKYYWDESSMKYKDNYSFGNGNKLDSFGNFKTFPSQYSDSLALTPDFQIPPSLMEKTKDLRQWLQNF